MNKVFQFQFRATSQVQRFCGSRSASSPKSLFHSSKSCFSSVETKIRVTLSNSNHVLSLRKGDICDEDAEAIVNAANSQLQHGGGIAAAIVKKGGYGIQTESNEYITKHGQIPLGEVAVTSPGSLKAK